jgi:hypothetical protein
VPNLVECSFDVQKDTYGALAKVGVSGDICLKFYYVLIVGREKQIVRGEEGCGIQAEDRVGWLIFFRRF